MKKILLLLFLPVALWAKDPIFNGKNLKGWYSYTAQGGKVDKADAVFKVKKGVIQMSGNQPGYIMTEHSYKEFKLSFEYKWNDDPSVPRASSKRNSGVMYCVPKDTPDALWPRGIQCQVKEGSTGDFILLKEVSLVKAGKRSIPGASVGVAGEKGFEKPTGEWNKVTIKFRNDTLTQKLNGHVVNVAVNPSVKKGRILIQYEGYPIDFKNLKLKKYNKD